MGTTKVGVYRKYYGPVPTDAAGNPLPPEAWGDRRAFSWAVRWFGTDGQRYSKSFPMRKLAERFAEKVQQEVRDGKADPPKKVTLLDFFREHKHVMAGNLAPKSLQMQVAAFEKLAHSVGWDCLVSRVSVRDIEKFRANRLKEGISPATANKELRTLRRVFNLAILRRYLPRDGNPCVGLQMLKVAPQRPAYIRPGEFVAIFRHAHDRYWRTFLTTIYSSGIRLREAMNLTWQDVDFAAGHLHVTRRTASGWVQAWTPKDHEMRTIPVPPQVIGLLTALRAAAPQDCPYVFLDESRWDFYCQQVTSGKWREGQDLMNNMLRRFQTICRRAKVREYTIHDLRRSCITNWARQLPIHVVQKLAGHSDIKTTQQFYLSVQADDLAKAQTAQESVLGELPTPTDPKLTHSAPKRAFPGRQGCQPKQKTPE